MNVETTLTDELRAVAASVQPPPAPIAELVHAAERARTRTRATRIAGAVLAAAAVVGAIVIGSHIGRPTTAPPPANPSPSYYAAGVPYVHRGTLYIDHKPQPGQWLSAETVGEYTAAVRADSGIGRLELGMTAVILRGGAEVDTVPGVVSGPVFSPRGTTMAWIASTGDDTGSLVVRDLTGFRDLGRLPLQLRPTKDEGLSISMDVWNDGTVYYELNDRLWSWKPGDGPAKADPVPPLDESVSPPGFPATVASVQLSPDHLWGAWMTDGQGRDLRDHSDRLAGFGLTVQKPGDPDSRFTIALPDAGLVQWESLSEVLVLMGDDNTADQRIFRCDVVKRQCKDATDTYAP